MTPTFDTTRSWGDDRSGAAPVAAAATAASNRRRRRVFALTLLLALAASLYWVWSQPPEYRAEARWQFVFAGRDDPVAAMQRTAETEPAFLTEIQVVTSRPLLEKLQAALSERGIRLPEPAAGAAAALDPVEALQRSLQVQPVAGTTIVKVQADAASAEPLAPVINTLFDLYRKQLDASHRSDASDAFERARDEAAALQVRFDQKRREADAFRARYDIVSLERDESQLLAQVKGQGVSLNTANDKAIAAQAKLAALRQSVAAGKAIALPRDNAALSSLEQRVSQTREQVRAMERSFTEAYMALDPDAKALRTRLANLEQQLKESRASLQQSLLADAEVELANARAGVAQLTRQMNGARQNVQAFTARLAEYKAMQQDLDRLDAQRGSALARATALELGSRRTAPSVREIEPASTPAGPWRPDYLRDTALAVGGSLLLALLTMGVVELFNRPDPAPPLLVERHWGMLEPLPQRPPLGYGYAGFDDRARPLPNPVPASARLLETAAPVRELQDREIVALLDAASRPARALLLALLAGLTAAEAAALDWADVDLAARTIQLPDRRVALSEPLAAALAALVDGGSRPDAPVFASGGERPTTADIDAAVGFVAHDAALPHADEIDAATLRDTCIAHLVRQGARFGDLAHWVGRLPPNAPGLFGRFMPSGPKRSADDIDPVLPALRRPAEEPPAADGGSA